MTLTDREYRGAPDHPGMAALAAECGDTPATADEVAFEMSTPGVDPVRDARVWEDGSGRILGWAYLRLDPVEAKPWGRLFHHAPSDPESRVAVYTRILRWAAGRVLGESQSRRRDMALTTIVKSEDSSAIAALGQVGLKPLRYYLSMINNHPRDTEPLTLPEGFAFSHCRGVEDAPKYVDAFNDTWIDHYGFRPLTEAEFVHDVTTDPEYVPQLDIVIEHDDGRFIGFAFCRMFEGENPYGEVMAMGVRRGFRGRGMARALLAHAMLEMVTRGAIEIHLDVDSENPTGAGRLYESMDFKVVGSKVRYSVDGAALQSLATAT